jgi:hypothetical protein
MVDNLLGLNLDVLGLNLDVLGRFENQQEPGNTCEKV